VVWSKRAPSLTTGPNKGVELTAYSVRSCLAPAFRRSSRLALDAKAVRNACHKLPRVRPCRCASPRHGGRRCSLWVLAEPVMPRPSWPVGPPHVWFLSPLSGRSLAFAAPVATSSPLPCPVPETTPPTTQGGVFPCARHGVLASLPWRQPVRPCPAVLWARPASHAASHGPMAPWGTPGVPGPRWYPSDSPAGVSCLGRVPACGVAVPRGTPSLRGAVQGGGASQWGLWNSPVLDTRPPPAYDGRGGVVPGRWCGRQAGGKSGGGSRRVQRRSLVPIPHLTNKD
jgi:hypothetical protein